MIWILAWFSSLHLVAAPPKLVVLVVIDQFRPDYLTRFQEHYLPAGGAAQPGGFLFLMEEGAYYPDAGYAHAATFTCPGHAAISSGSLPAESGVIANAWFDRLTGRPVHCVTDQRGLDGITRSPHSLRVTTLGDELQLATSGKSKIVSFSYKDYAAMMLGGRSADLALWFDYATGGWTSNAYYVGSAGLPEWVGSFNGLKIPDRLRGQSWELLLDESAYSSMNPDPLGSSPLLSRYGPTFPHLLADDTGFYPAYAQSGLGNEYLFELAKRAIEEEELGRDEVPDLLAMSLSSNDYVGHYYGPNSREMMDVTVRTDRLISDFLGFISQRIGKENVIVVVTSDHGVQAIPNEVISRRGAAGIVSRQNLIDAVDQALDSRFGPRDWVSGVTDLDLYFAPEALEAAHLDLNEVERTAARGAMSVEGIREAFGRSQILQGRLADTELARRISNNYHPQRSGDLILVYESNWFMEERVSTTHGTHHAYNSQVPILLWGAGINKGRFTRSVDPRDIAATLSHLLAIPPPSACTGRILSEAVR